MEHFRLLMNTEIFFGKGQIKVLGPQIKKIGSRVLLVWGEGSIQKSGLLAQVKEILAQYDLFFIELQGVQPNPRIDSVREGVRLCRAHHIDCILAVGGGSVIDCAKTIAAARYYAHDPWDFFVKSRSVKKALPVATILTLAATGSEMNGGAVISNPETCEKRSFGSYRLQPRFSILDPEYTYSVSPYQTACGIVDIMSHVFEQYFSPPSEAFIQNRLGEAILKTCVRFGPAALINCDDYEARANLMWAGSLALNGILGAGKETDWATHLIEHEISALYGLTHGAGLAILTPFWMKQVLSEKTAAAFAEYGRNVFNITDQSPFTAAEKAITATRGFFSSLGLPSTLAEAGIFDPDIDAIAEKTVSGGPVGSFHRLFYEDVREILKNAC